MSLALATYAAVASAAWPFIRGRLSRSHATGFGERCGTYTLEKLRKITNGKTLWLHAVSVGEVQAASPVISEIARSGWAGSVLLSTVTMTGARSAEMLLGENIAAHIYAPWDVPGITRRACDALRPSAYATVETEVWPNLLAELKRRGVPTFLLNARISDRTMVRPRFAKRLLCEAYGMFDTILARSPEDERRLALLGADRKRIKVTGDTKIDALIERKKSIEAELPDLRKKLFRGENVKCFVAGSTHEGEDEIVLDAFRRLTSGDDVPRGAKLVIVPRHPERAVSILSKARSVRRAALYSELSANLDAEVIIVDVIGVLFQLYGLAVSAFVGGSLVPRGGQNILEPAIWGVPVLHGPHMEDFAYPTKWLDDAKAAYSVSTAEDIEHFWREAAYGRLAVGRGAANCFGENAGAAGRTWKFMEKYL